MDQASRILILASDRRSASTLVDALAHEAGLSATARPLDATVEAEPGTDALVVAAQDAAIVSGIAQRVQEVPAHRRPGLLWVMPEGADATLGSAAAVGADDFVREPVAATELSARVALLVRTSRTRRALAERELDAKVIVELTQVLASALEFHEIVFTLVKRLAETVRVDRVSMVLVREDEPDVGHVVAASDNYQVTNLELDLTKYPEIQQTLRTGKALSIDDVRSHPVLEDVRGRMPEELSALFLFPIIWQDTPMGVLFLRTDATRTLHPRELDFCGAIANAAATALRNARVLERLKAAHRTAVSRVTSEAEQRGQALKAYQELFASAPDGIAVFTDARGLQFANPKAYDILGYSEEELRGRKLYDLLSPASGQTLREIWRALPRQRFTTDVDLIALHKYGREVIMSASFSMLDDGAVLVQFRDVTVERATEKELRKTKEFLESLINASVDAIVAADLSGTLILFNKGAERIYGYAAEEVIGHLHVSRLYPEGVAQEVMRKIRCPEFGGVGRLQSMHSCAVNREGHMIPISLSAAMIYENDQPVATVGIFTDLREKILAEERLAQAQKKLEVSEKQALLAELAGTAAHELNQPLTSVMGYGELLSRKLPPGSPERNAAQVIVRETERMADLVRKIGRITRYETKSYVGDQRILDLEKASDEEL